MIPAEPVIVDADLPQPPRCFRCAAVRCDYKAGDRQWFAIIGGSRDCEHAWTDRIEDAA